MNEQNKQNATSGQGALAGSRNPNHENLIRVYRAELHDDTGKVTITSDSLAGVQEKIDYVLHNGGKPYFEQRTTHTQLVYDRKGGAVVGWITEMELPSSVTSFTSKTAEQQAPAHVAA